MTVEIIPIKRSDCEELASMKGAKLLGVKYHYFPSLYEGKNYVGGAGVDGLLPAVVLDLGDLGAKTITWSMKGALEGLAVFSGEYQGGIWGHNTNFPSMGILRQILRTHT